LFSQLSLFLLACFRHRRSLPLTCFCHLLPSPPTYFHLFVFAIMYLVYFHLFRCMNTYFVVCLFEFQICAPC
jgi:hypothetical protein